MEPVYWKTNWWGNNLKRLYFPPISALTTFCGLSPCHPSRRSSAISITLRFYPFYWCKPFSWNSHSLTNEMSFHLVSPEQCWAGTLASWSGGEGEVWSRDPSPLLFKILLLPCPQHGLLEGPVGPPTSQGPSRTVLGEGWLLCSPARPPLSSIVGCPPASGSVCLCVEHTCAGSTQFT